MRLCIPSSLLKACFPLISLSTALAFPSASAAYCPVPEIRANGEYFKSDIAFIGTVLSVRKKRDVGDDIGGWYYRLRVEKRFRGPAREQVTVFTEDSDIRFPLEVNRQYLLFAYRQHGRLEIDSCGNSALISEAGDSLRRLEKLRRGESLSEIEGWVVGETGGIDVSGVRVTLRSRSKTYTAVTDKDGWFHFQAPPGRYQVDFASKEYYLNADDFWYDPGHFAVHAGECASLQFVSVRHLIK